MIIVCHLFPLKWRATEINGHFCEKYCLCMIVGLMTQCRFTILGNGSKNVGETLA